MLPYITLLSIDIQTYYIMATVAGLSGFLLAIRQLKDQKIGSWQWKLPILVVFVALAGARILNFILNPSAYGEVPIWSISYRNLSIMGGLITGTLTIIIYSVVNKKDFWSIMDKLILPAGVVIMLLKTGCFLNGCCYGKPTKSIFGVVFKDNKALIDYMEQFFYEGTFIRTVHPTQIYEIFGAGIGLLIVFTIMKKRKLPKGSGALIYAIWYTSVRLLIHPMRTLPYEKVVVSVFYPMFYIIIIVSLFILLIRRCQYILD